MPSILFANDANTTLAGTITNTSLTANLAAGSGVLFPVPTGGQHFLGSFRDAATGLLTEIVRVTSITGDTITMVRGQESTTARGWSAGDIFLNACTAGTMAALVQSSDFTGANQSLANPGFENMPGGFIRQFGNTSIGANSIVTLSYATPFLVGALNCNFAIGSTSTVTGAYPPNMNIRLSGADLTHFQMANPNSFTVAYDWEVWGT